MKPLLPRTEAVLFDLDGTLVETNIDFQLMRRRMVELALQNGVPPERLDGLDILAIVDVAVEHARKQSPTASAKLRDQALSMLEEIECTHAAATREIPFARELLDCLRRNSIPTGIVTRNCRRASQLSMQIAGINTGVLVCREDSRNHKPHPEPLLAALRELKARPEASIMVGDHLMDVQGGKAAGMKTIGFLRDTRPPDFFDAAKPDLVATSLREVLLAIVDCSC